MALPVGSKRVRSQCDDDVFEAPWGQGENLIYSALEILDDWAPAEWPSSGSLQPSEPLAKRAHLMRSQEPRVAAAAAAAHTTFGFSEQRPPSLLEQSAQGYVPPPQLLYQTAPLSSKRPNLQTLENLRKQAGNQLRGSNFQGGDLNKACFEGVDVSGANFISASLKGATFKKANLEEADLGGAKLESAKFEDANLKKANLSGTTMTKSTMITSAQLEGAHLRYVTGLRLHSFQNKNLSGVDFYGSNLANTDFRGAILTGANFEDNILVGADFTGAIMDNVTFKVRVDYVKPDERLDRDLNHLANGRSLLLTIHTISNPVLRVSLMEQLVNSMIEKLNIKNATSIRRIIFACSDSIYDVLCRSEDYIASPIIYGFIQKYLIANVMTNSNFGGKKFNSAELNLFIKHVLENKELIKTNNGFISQLIHSSISNSDDGSCLSPQGIALYEAYKASIDPLLIQTFSDELAAEWNPVYNMLLISKCQKHAILVDSNYYLNYAFDALPTESLDWNNFYYIKYDEENKIYEDCSDADKDLVDIFNRIVLFRSNYNFYHQKQRTARVLHILDLGNYHEDFVNVLHKISARSRKLVKDESQVELSQIFSKFYDDKQDKSKLILKDEWTVSILREFNPFKVYTPQDQALILLCFSTLFVKLSSSSVFGTEGHSPEAIRYFALACLNKAAENNQLETIVAEDELIDWRNRLTGRAFSCTAVLFRFMQNIIKRYPEFYDALIPQTFR